MSLLTFALLLLGICLAVHTAPIDLTSAATKSGVPISAAATQKIPVPEEVPRSGNAAGTASGYPPVVNSCDINGTIVPKVLIVNMVSTTISFK